jgi:hypothetical protein
VQVRKLPGSSRSVSFNTHPDKPCPATAAHGRGADTRRYYEITADGWRTLAAFIEEWSRFRDSVDELFNSTVRHP